MGVQRREERLILLEHSAMSRQKNFYVLAVPEV